MNHKPEPAICSRDTGQRYLVLTGLLRTQEARVTLGYRPKRFHVAVRLFSNGSQMT